MTISNTHLRAGLLLATLSATAHAQSTQLVSVTAAGIPANGPSEEPLISADGRVVFFRSWATNLAHGDPDATFDAYAKDLTTGAIELCSVNSNGEHAAGVNITCGISANGNLVCFQSDAANLAPGDSGSDIDVFVRDRTSGTTTIVSVDSNGVHGNADSENAALSPDGRFVAFQSLASNLVPGDTNNEWDVFVHDLQTGATERVNLGPGGTQTHGYSYVTALSFDGRYVLFSSLATDLVVGDTNNERDIFVRDRMLGTTRRVSVTSSGAQSNGDSHARYMSADGRFVTFVSIANNLVPGDTNAVQDVFVHELATATTTRASVSSTGAQADGPSDCSAISADGRFLTIASTATNFVPGDLNFSDVFVHDQWSGQTTRVGLAPDGSAPNGNSGGGTLSADGRKVAFYSSASNMHPSVAGGINQVYVRDRGPASPFAPLCTGDFGAACPCNNNSTTGANEGCQNSFGSGGRLVGQGAASLASDTLVLVGDHMPSAAALYFQGTAPAGGGVGNTFGDGLRCAAGAVTRLATTTNVNGASQYPAGSQSPVSVRGGVIAPSTRVYQVWYRNAASFCTPSAFNLTNGLWVAWAM